MGKARFSYSLFGVGLALAGLVMHCKPKKQEIPAFGDVHLDVLDENKKPIDSAVIYLYNSKEAFDQAAQNAKNGVYNATGSIVEATVVDGKIVFPQLPSNSEYWVLAHDVSGFFVDGLTTTTFPIDRDNVDAFFYIPSFQNGTTVTAIVNLVPATSLIKFTSNAANDVFTKVRLGDSDKQGGFISGSYMPVRKGNLPYFIRTDQCVWTGEVVAVGGKVVTQNLANCAYTQYTFTSVAGNFVSSADAIKIYIGQNTYDASRPPVAILSAAQPTQTVVLASDGKGYTYFAVHGNGKCVWEGTVGSSVTLNTCY